MLHIPSAICYFFLSTIMVFGNKYLLNTWSFDYPITLILSQTLLTVFALYKAKNIFKIKIENVFDSQHISSMKYQIFTALFYSLHSITALKALSGLNIPMYATFKRCAPLVNLIIQRFYFNKPNQNRQGGHATKILLNGSIILMTVGAVIAGLGDLTFDLKTYVFCGFSVIFQALYLAFIQKCGETETNSMQTFYYSNYVSVPLLAISFFLTSEFKEVTYSKPFLDKELGFVAAFFMVLICGSFLCFSQFWCTSHNNALTTSVVGVLKSFLQTIVGMFLFDAKNQIGLYGYIGISINLLCGSLYTYLKYIEKEKKINKHSSVLDMENLISNNDIKS